MKIKNLILSLLLLGSFILVGCGGSTETVGGDNSSGTDNNSNETIIGNDITGNNDLNVSTSACVEIASHIVSDTVWSASCYKVVVDLDVDAQLTIKEGTKVYFEAGRNMRVDTGKLIAIGTADKPIIFTSDDKSRGYWDGLSFYGSDSSQNEISYMIVEYAKIGLDVTSVGSSVSRLSISNSTFRQNSEYGFRLNKTAILDKFEHIHSHSNAISGYTYANSLYALGAYSDFTGNDKDYIEVYGDIVTTTQTWNALNVPALFTHNVEIDTFLTIKAGASFLCGSGISIRIDAGALEAIGTATQPITFSANQKTKGYWEGINFYGSDDTKNVLSYVHISYATTALNVTGTTTSRLRINDNNLSYNKDYGFIFETHSAIDNFSNILSYQNDIAGKVTVNMIYSLDENSSFVGNTNDYIETTDATLTTPQTWNKLTVPILITTDTDIDAFLTINAGASFLFDANVGLRIDTGALTAIGTATQPITFTGKQQTVGYWDNIYFYGSNDTNNKMSYVELSYGGYTDMGLLIVGTTSSLVISNAKINNSQGYGIETACNTNITDNGGIIYANNTQIDYYHPTNCSP